MKEFMTPQDIIDEIVNKEVEKKKIDIPESRINPRQDKIDKYIEEFKRNNNK